MSTQRQTMPGNGAGSAATLLLAVLSAAAIIVVIVLFAIGKSGWAIPVAVLALLVGGAALVDSLAARRKVSAHGGNAAAVEADATDPLPIQAQTGGSPLGASTEVHTDVNPHDIPRGNPAREEAKERRGEGPPVDTRPRPVPPGEPEPGG